MHCSPLIRFCLCSSHFSMETKTPVRRYETRRSSRLKEPEAKTRVDWRRTKRNVIVFNSDDDNDEELSSPEDELSSSLEDEKNETVVQKSSFADHEKKTLDTVIVEDAEDEPIASGKRKRLSASVMYDSDGSDDSDIPVRKVFAKRNCIMDEETSSQEQQHPCSTLTAEENLPSKDQKVLTESKHVPRPNAIQTSDDREYCEESSDETEIEESFYKLPLTPTESSDDDESMKDFIVDDDDEEEFTEDDENLNLLPERALAPLKGHLVEYYIPHLSRCDHYVHFQRVVKAFLINAIDDTFLCSLYDGTRQKRYARDMLTSLHYLDDRFIQPRLENLTSRSRWKERYKERVDSYPNVRIIMTYPVNMSCQACEMHRYCKFDVLLSGKLYSNKTLETDDFMSHDKQVLKVGVVCANRTRVYHKLKHFKYKLYLLCCSKTELEDVEDESVKDTVERLFNQLKESGWIQKEYNKFESYMDAADLFQEEKID
ncbi:PREDICTED: coiled-coil domain-containing protein 82 isoform X1 [Gavialis gangeticus]|uniref:coiled-coil domain-containing protein 82 isoform X1 n=2 Tax=Gavialis gangeticus TaxID=94835 RepID=UPI00092FA3A8|nr:PREDICTED: coiled-coil domain-containing protein 82 isoform X1 [Gavialis gangeticus]